MRRNVKRTIQFVIFLVCAMIIYTMAVNNTAYLKKPDKIQIISGENITEYLKDTAEYASIYKVIKEAWEETTVHNNHPVAILLAYMNPDEVEQITIEVRFYYKNSTTVKRGESKLAVQYYSFFPMDDELSMVALTEEGDYVSDAVLYTISFTDEQRGELKELCLTNIK